MRWYLYNLEFGKAIKTKTKIRTYDEKNKGKIKMKILVSQTLQPTWQNINTENTENTYKSTWGTHNN